jgi:hypothetical protein
VIVFWSDHGWSLGDHFHWKKWALWECVSNVPLLIARPGDTGGNVVSTPVSTLDLYPTLARIADLPARPEWEGQSLVPLLDDPQAPWDRPARTTYGPGNHALRARDATYIRYADGSEELYDPANDPREENNLAGDPAWQETKLRLAARLPRDEALPLHRATWDREKQLAELQCGQVLEFGCMEPGFLGRGFTIEARFELEAGADDAVILHHNSRFVGYALYVKDGRLCLTVRNVPSPLPPHNLELTEQTLTSHAALPAGPVTVRARLAHDGQARLWIDDAPAGQTGFPGPLAMHPLGYLSVGHSTDRCRLEKPYPLLPELAESCKQAFPGELASCSLTRE